MANGQSSDLNSTEQLQLLNTKLKLLCRTTHKQTAHGHGEITVHSHMKSPKKGRF